MTSVKEQNKELAFEDWFKREYPLYFDAARGMRDTTLYEQLRKAWNAGAERKPATEAVLEDKLAWHLDGEHHAIRAQEIDSPVNSCPFKETCQWVKRIALRASPSPEPGMLLKEPR